MKVNANDGIFVKLTTCNLDNNKRSSKERAMSEIDRIESNDCDCQQGNIAIEGNS